MTVLLKILVLSFMTTFSRANSQVCFGDQCETPNYLEDTEQCQGLECESKENLLELISHLQKEKHDAYMAPIRNPLMINRKTSKEVMMKAAFSTGEQNNPICSVCNDTSLCINGGACVPEQTNPLKNYYCICPDHTSGKNCEKIIECKNNTCGENAECSISNHQVNCVCKPGYTARGNRRDCDLKVQEACMHGDPHYTTFDGLNFDYEGTCSYVFSQPCKTLAAPFSHYSVRAKNEVNGTVSHASAVSEVEVDMHNMTIHIDVRSKNVLVDKNKVDLPWFYPFKNDWVIRIQFNGKQWIVNNDQGVTVTFTTSFSLCVSVPDVPEFRGKDTLCGLAGNLDGLWQNDVVNANGTVLKINSDRQPETNNYNNFMKFEDSWITKQFLVLRKQQKNCQRGEVVPKNTTCIHNGSGDTDVCYPIIETKAGKGPFAGCKGLNTKVVEDFYNSCRYDVCRVPNFKCTALTQYVQYCQANLPGAKIDPQWRKKVNCLLACPLNSHHSICTSSCPPTCSRLNPGKCNQGCSDGCKCDPGYVIQPPITDPIKCVRPSQCGCIDENGLTRQPGFIWLSENCTVSNECQDGSIRSESVSCAAHSTCVTLPTGLRCSCMDGFREDGGQCIEINKCKENPGICGNHGKCCTTPGSYYCSCDTYYVGEHCEHYKPRRHCADLYVYWKNRTDGVYTLNPPYALPNKEPFDPSPVYCDMTTSGGGFTLISSDVSNLNENKTYQEYISGFGSAENRSVWLGLEFIHQMTTNQTQTLRLNLDRCASNGRPAKSTYCTYSTFSVLDASTQYSVVIRESCNGTEADDNYYQDGWARWDLSKNGPKFSTWDLKVNTASEGLEDATFFCLCSKANLNTGWWYTKDRLCGAANLNGVRYTCPNIPEEDDKYLKWSQGTLGQASMYLRPVGYPKYDSIQ